MFSKMLGKRLLSLCYLMVGLLVLSGCGERGAAFSLSLPKKVDLYYGENANGAYVNVRIRVETVNADDKITVGAVYDCLSNCDTSQSIIRMVPSVPADGVWISDKPGPLISTLPSDKFFVRVTVTNDKAPGASVTGYASVLLSAQSPTVALPSPRKNHTLTVFSDPNNNNKDSLFLIGGEDNGGKMGDVWKSENGVDWVQIADNLIVRAQHQVGIVKDPAGKKELVLTGGLGDSGPLNDVYTSYDGVNWKQQSSLSSSRYGQQVVNDASVFYEPDRLYMFGGLADTGSFFTGPTNQVLSFDTLNQVWIGSSIGANSIFSPRVSHQVVVMNNSNDDYRMTFFTVGGVDNTGILKNDVWKSVVGASTAVEWTQIMPSAPFLPRRDHQLVAFPDFTNGDKPTMFLIGGSSSAGAIPLVANLIDDVWKSVDGANWAQVLSSSRFSARSSHRVAVKRDLRQYALFLVGGFDGSGYRNDVWKSEDGISWYQPKRVSLSLR